MTSATIYRNNIIVTCSYFNPGLYFVFCSQMKDVTCNTALDVLQSVDFFKYNFFLNDSATCLK